MEMSHLFHSNFICSPNTKYPISLSLFCSLCVSDVGHGEPFTSLSTSIGLANPHEWSKALSEFSGPLIDSSKLKVFSVIFKSRNFVYLIEYNKTWFKLLAHLLDKAFADNGLVY